MTAITTLTELDALYGKPAPTATVKEVTALTPQYRALIEASSFLALATSGPEGLDCSPRGDAPGRLVRIADDTTLLLPDRRGNNRADSLRNILRDPRVGLMFLIPGSRSAVRVNGRARLETDAALQASFAVDGATPRCVIVITIDAVFFQCGRAIERAGLWDASRFAASESLPTPGDILASLSNGALGGADYDRAWPERAKKTMW
jgi:uncharacterized protein